MYSTIPMPHVDWKPENMRYVMCCFPLVGAVIGAMVYGWLWLAQLWQLNLTLTAAVAAAVPVLISGGIHLDGFCDTSDALASHAPMDKKLEILKDSHIGAFALIACCIYLMLDFGFWSQIGGITPKAGAVTVVGFMLSRALSGLSVVSFRCAKNSGLAAMFSDASEKSLVGAVLLCEVFLCAFLMLSISLSIGAVCLISAVAVFLFYKRMAYRQFGGITGDLAGYFLQMCELFILIAAVAAGAGTV